MNRLIVVMLLGFLLVGSVACLGSTAPKPVVSDIPQGWDLNNEEPYGTYLEQDGTEWGLVEYTDSKDLNFVQIFYGNVPPDLRGKETDKDALIDRAILESTFEPEETGIMMASGEIAGYTERYDPGWDWYEREIVFVTDTGCIDIYTIYDATPEAEAQAMAIIDSITF